MREVKFCRLSTLGRAIFINLALLMALTLAAFDAAPKDQGIGGTGTASRGDDQGLTGTGYLGTILGFGSIIINGQEVELSDKAVVQIDGAAGTIADLKIGQVIAARTKEALSGEYIQSIDVLHVVIGQVKNFDTVSGRGMILGQSIDFNSRVDQQNIANGDWVAVSGLRAPNGLIVASRVDASQGEEFLVRGTTAQIRKALAALDLKSRDVPSGSFLVLSGSMEAGLAQIQPVQNLSLKSFFRGAKNMLIETYVSADSHGNDRLPATIMGEKLLLKNGAFGSSSGTGGRLVIEGTRRDGGMVVRRSSPAGFDDAKSLDSIKRRKLDGGNLSPSNGPESPSSPKIEPEEAGSDGESHGSGGSEVKDQNGGKDGSDKGDREHEKN